MVKVKLTEKLDSEILVVGFGTVDKKLKIEAGPSQIDTAALLATLIAMGAS
ncbi:MAG: leucyl aminopeptidase, partial [Actinobacteria bacterium]|nr:leucyl aminopeptidase [Actinomycetota bacterium]